MKKQNIIIITIILVVLTLSIGYSIFRTSTTVIGRTSAVKNLDVNFIKIGKINYEGCDNIKASILSDNKSIVINIPKLEYKGAYAIIPITLKNTGNIPARLYSIYEYGLDDSSAIKVTYEGIGATNVTLKPGDTINFNLKVAWENDLDKNFEFLEFIIKFNYVQA